VEGDDPAKPAMALDEATSGRGGATNGKHKIAGLGPVRRARGLTMITSQSPASPTAMTCHLSVAPEEWIEGPPTAYAMFLSMPGRTPAIRGAWIDKEIGVRAQMAADRQPRRT
jgi:hypothetical protein